jgi:methionyl-tRNA formyltransferase
LKVVFLGTPDFGVPAIQQILNSKHQLVAVLCQPDKVGSRNKVSYCAVKQFALANNLPLYQFEKVSRDGVDTLKSLAPDIMVTAAYGQILSDEVIAIAPHGVINIHGSLLPALRGAAPIQYAVWQGMTETGITILNTVKKVDAGEIIMQESLPIFPNETSGELFDRMAQLGGKLIVQALDAIQDGTAVYTPQDESKATHSAKILSSDEVINWQASANQVHNTVRALNPNPVAWTTYQGKRLKIFKTQISDYQGQGDAGQIVQVTKKFFTVACGQGFVDVLELQMENGKRMTTQAYLCGKKVAVGEVLGE